MTTDMTDSPPVSSDDTGTEPNLINPTTQIKPVDKVPTRENTPILIDRVHPGQQPTDLTMTQLGPTPQGFSNAGGFAPPTNKKQDQWVTVGKNNSTPYALATIIKKQH